VSIKYSPPLKGVTLKDAADLYGVPYHQLYYRAENDTKEFPDPIAERDIDLCATASSRVSAADSGKTPKVRDFRLYRYEDVKAYLDNDPVLRHGDSTPQ